MRLNDFEMNTIKETASRYFGRSCRVILFGSRADDSAKGGDIDLFIETRQSIKNALDRKPYFLVELKTKIGDRKIDVVLKGLNSRDKLIYKVAEKEGVEIR
jgi:uncharacterized protein